MPQFAPLYIELYSEPIDLLALILKRLLGLTQQLLFVGELPTILVVRSQTAKRIDWSADAVSRGSNRNCCLGDYSMGGLASGAEISCGEISRGGNYHRRRTLGSISDLATVSTVAGRISGRIAPIRAPIH